MAKIIDIVVPEGVSDATVVEIIQQVGCQLAEEQSLVAVETDKATAEVPSPAKGRLLELSVAVGDIVSSSDVIGKLEIAGEAQATKASVEIDTKVLAGELVLRDIVVPDGISNAAVVEIMQTVGAVVAEDQSLIAIETDKATAEVPVPVAGAIAELAVKIGDIVSSGDIIGKLQSADTVQTVAPASPLPPADIPIGKTLDARLETISSPVAAVPANVQKMGASVHASPSVRQFARELGVDLTRIKEPSGPKKRITFGDVKGLVKGVMSSSIVGHTSHSGAAGIPVIELPDFSKFGPIEEQELSKVKQITGEHLSKGWLNIPLVTHFEETDITGLEDFRKELNNRVEVSKGELPKATALAFIVRAVVKVLQQYPQVNSSLSSDKKSLILKKYYHIGIAVDTPRGLLVPVIKNADRLSLDEISSYIKDLGTKGRSGKLDPKDMKGGSFTISSLGGLGGTNFTPLVNPPEAAILGVAKSAWKPVWNGKEFVARLMLPFSVSYDHRILDGGEIVRFATALANYLRDLRYILV